MAEISADRAEVADRLSELEALRLTEVRDLEKELFDIEQNKKEMETRKGLELDKLVEKVADITAAYSANLCEMKQVLAERIEVRGPLGSQSRDPGQKRRRFEREDRRILPDSPNVAIRRA